MKDVTDSSGTIHYDYDEWNELIQVTYPGNVIVSYDYDELGNRTSMTYPSGKVVDYTYDIMNRLKTVTLEGALEGAAPGAAAYTWNALSQREQLELPNGSKADYTYDALNRLESLTNKTSTDSVIAAFTYTHDKVGNRKTMIDNDGLHNYTYDSAYQLTNVDYPAKPDQGYAYDPAGNRETVTEGGAPAAYTTDNMNRYTAVDTATYGYDNNGCLTSKTDASGTATYRYDFENRLISYALSIGGEGRGEGVYTYDYLGRRIKVNNNSTITCYVYDNNRVIAEYNSTGLICEYVYGNSIDEVLFMIKGANAYYYHYDGLGSVRAITDESEAVVETYTYDVYGKPTIYDTTHTEISESQFGNRYYFTGREFDKETGLYYYRARYYDPGLGRFLQSDPVGYSDSINFYLYVHNNPISFIDQFGEDTYSINNNFGSSTPTNSDLSHTFGATTDNGKVTDTYSWVPDGGGSWEDTNDKQNMEGAQKAIDSGVGATKVGDEGLDSHIDDLFEKRKGEKGGFWGRKGNCKKQTKKLIDDAIRDYIFRNKK